MTMHSEGGGGGYARNPCLSPETKPDIQEEDPIRSLMCTVVERALDDIRFMYQMKQIPSRERKKHDKVRLRQCTEFDPITFIEGDWCKEICGGLGLPYEKILDSIATPLDFLKEARG